MIEWLILGKLVAGFCAAYTVYIIVRTVFRLAQDIVTWCRIRSNLMKQHTYAIAFTIKEAQKHGRCGVCQEIFDERSEKVLDCQPYTANELDSDLAQLHRSNEVVMK